MVAVCFVGVGVSWSVVPGGLTGLEPSGPCVGLTVPRIQCSFSYTHVSKRVNVKLS